MFARVLSKIFYSRNRSTIQEIDATSSPMTVTEVHVCTTEVKTVEDSHLSETTPLPYTATTPPPAAYYSPVQLQDSMMSDFFGGRTSTVRSRDSQAFLPPYSTHSDSEVLPAYPGHPRDEPATLARYMFIYGFCMCPSFGCVLHLPHIVFSVFPLFWLMGVAILLSPLKPTPEWEMGKTREEQTALLSRMRTEELKWAKRCLWATLTLFAVLAAVAVTIYLSVFRK